jgi:SAM-dependent methyltransferase
LSSPLTALDRLDDWLGLVRDCIQENDPALLAIFEIYAGEARFGRRYIDSNLAALPAGASILEVGAGSLLLSCQLAREGFDVHALEPIGDGFSHFYRMRSLVIDRASHLGSIPKTLDIRAEDLQTRDRFDYAFSINVMEHVDEVSEVISAVGQSLKFGAIYRFTCPNYLFPYEPHFHILTVFSKRWTERLFRKRIYEKAGIPDAAGLWNSLNWVTVRRIKRAVANLPEFRVSFGRQLIVSTLERAVYDRAFASRRSRWMLVPIRGIVALRLHRFLALVPAALQPIIDCSVARCQAETST